MFDFLSNIPLIGDLLTTVVPFVIVLSIVIAIHEYGHYIVGRWCGIHAEVFSLGFGPVLMSRIDKRGTRWQVAAIPLGGYVRFLGDANAASQPGKTPVDESIKHRTLNGAKLYKRALTVFAGPAANFILSIILFSGIAYTIGVLSNEPVVGKLANLPQSNLELREGDEILAINGTEVTSFTEILQLSPTLDPSSDTIYTVQRDGHQKDVIGPFLLPALVDNVMPVSPASKAGLKSGDVIIAVGDKKLRSFPELSTIIKAANADSVNLKVWRNNQEIDIPITPAFRDVQISTNEFEKRMMIGVGAGYAFLAPINDITISEAVVAGVNRTYFVITSSINGIYQIFAGKVGAENLQGPLGIARMSADTASSGLLDLISLIAFISTAIGFLNLLPIPVLDGGHLVMFGYEALFRRAPNMKVVQVAMTVGIAMLFSLMIFATFNDIMRL